MSLSSRVTSLRRLGRTLADIGLWRLQRRLRYELRQRLDHLLPPRLALGLAVAAGPVPSWQPVLQELASAGLAAPACWHSVHDPGSRPAAIAFSFLGDTRELSWPILWNDSNWPRLWQFHLHYFDWARSWLETALGSGHWPAPAWALEPLLDHWIRANPPGRGDGWHSYTLSLRTRNWIWLFRCCPPLVTPARLQSLWQQLCWLQAHPEHCHGGNHWLENLTALAIGGLQFDGQQARVMHRRALRLLQQELKDQVLADGGHQERSSSYHLLMLDRLSELACVLQATTGERPPWLLEALTAMTGWAEAIRLEDGSTPRFNDSAPDAAPSLDRVTELAVAVIQPGGPPLQALYARLNPASPWNLSHHSADPPKALVDLPDTGWTLLRPEEGWELAFKCGYPCPPHLGAHAHSDLLSFDLWHHGRPVLAEVATSIYGYGADRGFERSSLAHNSLQLGRSRQDGIAWIEPVEVWAGFRAGSKARPHSRQQGQQGPWLWAAGSHDGYRAIKAQHFRWLAMRSTPVGLPVLVVLDAISCRQPVHWRGWWHLGPGFSPSLEELGLRWQSWPEHSTSQAAAQPSYLARGFGDRQPRSTLQRAGTLPAGQHVLVTALAHRAMAITWDASPLKGSLELPDLGRVHWRWPGSVTTQHRSHSAALPVPQVWCQG